MNKKLLFLFLLLPFWAASQNNREILYGVVNDTDGVLADVHIINLNTKQGTHTNKEGVFRVFAKEKDIIQISFVGYETKIITLTEANFGLSDNKFPLQKSNIELDEVVVKRHNLTGNLSADIKQVPKDTIAEIVDNLESSILNLDYEAIMNMPIGADEIHLAKPSTVGGFSGVGGGIPIPYKKDIERRKLKKDISFKEKFPQKILTLLGKDFFFNQLKIPKDKYYHFIEYCSFKNIEELFKNEEILELIRTLQEESITYHKVIKQH